MLSRLHVYSQGAYIAAPAYGRDRIISIVCERASYTFGPNRCSGLATWNGAVGIANSAQELSGDHARRTTRAPHRRDASRDGGGFSRQESGLVAGRDQSVAYHYARDSELRDG